MIEQSVQIGSASLAVKHVLNESWATPDVATIVFLHDSLGSIELWRDFPERLANAAKCNFLVYDRQGYGRSSSSAGDRSIQYLEDEAYVLITLLGAMNVRNPVLFGHSDGGSIALLAAAYAPQAIAAVISEGAHVFVEEVTLAGIRDAQVAWTTTNLRQRLLKYHHDNTDWVYHAWSDTWLSPQFRNWNIESHLKTIICPLLVMQGERDEYGTERQVDAILSGASSTVKKKLMVPGVGHSPHKEAPELVLDECAGFLRSIRDSSLSPLPETP